MSDDARIATLLHQATADVPDHHDVHALVGRAVATGRRTRARRRAGLVGAAVVAAGGVGVALGVGGDTGRAVDPLEPADRTSEAATGPDPVPAVPRTLAVSPADVVGTVRSLLPGEVRAAPAQQGEQNPQGGFDPRPDAATTTFPATEPGPGLLADLLWDGVELRVAVAPSDPGLGATALERCRGAGEGGNGACVPTGDGGVLQETSFTADDGAVVRLVNRWTPDLWVVTAMSQGLAEGRRPTSAYLETLATSGAWFAPAAASP